MCVFTSSTVYIMCLLLYSPCRVGGSWEMVGRALRLVVCRVWDWSVQLMGGFLGCHCGPGTLSFCVCVSECATVLKCMHPAIIFHTRSKWTPRHPDIRLAYTPPCTHNCHTKFRLSITASTQPPHFPSFPSFCVFSLSSFSNAFFLSAFLYVVATRIFRAKMVDLSVRPR